MRLIDADALYRSFGASGNCNACPLDAYKCQYYREHTLMEFCESIDDAPTIDAVPVVRCKDCVYWGKNFRAADGKRGDCMNSSGAGTSAEHFCAYGEKRCD